MGFYFENSLLDFVVVDIQQLEIRFGKRIVKRDKVKAKTLQVGFLAMNKKGEHGACAIQKGFVYSLKTASENKIVAAKYII